MRERLRRHWLLLLMVVLPTLVAAVYYGLIASDIYISESRFIVRNPQHAAPTGVVGALLQGTALARSMEDTYSVHDYMLSRDALRELDQRLHVRETYSNPAIDFFDRFHARGWFSSFEDFYRYYGRRVSVDYDTVSSISVLTVRAYTAEDAYRINGALLEMGERLVNQLNERSREDLIRFADHEVQIASDRAREAALAMLAYRSTHSVYEPDKQAALQLEGVSKIEQELVATEAQIAQLRKLSPANPQIGALETRAQALRNAMAGEASKVTRPQGSFSTLSASFERLVLDSTFADKELGVALAGLETARAEALQKQLYIERLVQPDLPDKAMEPKRIRGVLTVLAFSLVAWGVVSLLMASVREHTD